MSEQPAAGEAEPGAPPGVVPQAPDRVGVPWARRPWDPQPVSPEPGDWWAPGAVNPHPPVRAVAGASSYTPHAGRRIDSSGPWRVLDLGASVSLSCGPPTQELVFLGVQVRPRRDRTVLTADGAGLHLVPEGDAGAERTVVGWGQIAQLVSVRPPGLDTEVWHVERLDGSRLPVVSAPLPGGLRASQLRSIVQGIAVIPTRFGGPAVAVDGVVDTSPGRYARLTAPRRAPA